MTGEPIDEQLRHINERMTILEGRSSEAFDHATRLFQQSHNALTRLMTVFSVLFALSAGAIGFQTYSTWERFRETLQREQANSVRRLQILPYIARLDAGRRKLRSGPEDQKDTARWDDLLGTLKNTPPAILYDIVLEFKNVIPELRIPI